MNRQNEIIHTQTFKEVAPTQPPQTIMPMVNTTGLVDALNDLRGNTALDFHVEMNEQVEESEGRTLTTRSFIFKGSTDHGK